MRFRYYEYKKESPKTQVSRRRDFSAVDVSSTRRNALTGDSFLVKLRYQTTPFGHCDIGQVIMACIL